MSVHFRLDPEDRAKVRKICKERGICESDFYRERVREGLNSWDSTMNTGRGTSIEPTLQYIPHNSNPGIKLVRSIEERGTAYYFDTEGHRWLMDKDGTLISVGRPVERKRGGFDVLFK